MKGIGILSIFLAVPLFSCYSQTATEKSGAISASPDMIVLDGKSPKLKYITEAEAPLMQRPLLDLVTGKVVYDETRTVRVSSPISGRVIGKIAEIGLQVNVADILVELDSPELAHAQATYAESLADFEMVKRAYGRVQSLFEYDIAPRKAVDEAEDQLVRARSETERNRIKLANLGVHNRQMDGRFVLRAPLAGIVTERNINPGMEVKPDLPLPLFVISDLSRLWVLIDIFEKDIGLISRGAHVRIHVPAYPEESFVATIDYISQVVDETSRTVKVRCIIQNEDKRLLPAMFASATVLSDPGDRVVIIPLTALFSEGESDWVYIDTGNHRYLKRRVTVGLRTRNQAVIRDGLNPGERFVADGALLLRAEQKQHANEQ